MSTQPAPEVSGLISPDLVITLSFVPDSQISPAAPLNFSWKLFILSTQSLGGSVTATLSVDGTQIWTSGLVPVTTNVIYGKPPAPNWYQQFTSLQQDQVQPLPAGSAAAQALYHLGSKSLQLQIVGAGPNPPGPYTADAVLNVVAGPFDGSFWQWGAIPTTVAWKSSYALSGVYTNESLDPLTSVLATLIQNGATDLQTLNFGPVGSQLNTGPVGFTSITQSWQWMDDITFINVDSTVKTFTYTVSIHAQDAWDNQYQATSTPVSVVVAVPLWKINDQTLALAGAANAANLLVAAAAAALTFQWELAAGFIAAAGIAYGAAQAAAGSAKDPPDIDPSYREPVEARTASIPAEFSGSPALDALARLFRLLLKIASENEAVTTVEGRILGAIDQSDAEALQMQAQRRTELVRSMNETAMALPMATGAAIEASQEDRWLNASDSRESLLQWRANGVPQTVRDLAISNGMRPETFSAIEMVIKRIPVELLLIPIPQQILSMSLAIGSWAIRASGQASV